MKRNHIIALLVGINFILFSGIVVLLLSKYSVDHFPKNYARVTIKNSTDNTITNILLTHSYGKLQADALQKDEEIRFVFKNYSENTYTVQATLQNNETISSQPIHCDYGYKGTNVITNEGLKAE